jgi:hypothetical protein
MGSGTAMLVLEIKGLVCALSRHCPIWKADTQHLGKWRASTSCELLNKIVHGDSA